MATAAADVERARAASLPAYVRESELARMLDCHPVTLRHWRRAGKGPPWTKLGAKIIAYPMASCTPGSPNSRAVPR